MRRTLLVLAVGSISMQAAAEQRPYSVAPVSDGGRIMGRVLAGSAAAKVQRYIIPKQAEICGGPYRDAVLVDVQAGALQDVVVYLEDVTAGKPFAAAAKKVTINQLACRFEPFLSGLMNGGELEAVNSDPLLHNIHIYEMIGRSRNNVANVSQPRKGDILAMSVTIDQGKALKVECDAHDFMHAYVFVARNPYYAIARRDGSFEIADIPPGRYTVRAWHPYLGEKEKTIEIQAGGLTETRFEY